MRRAALACAGVLVGLVIAAVLGRGLSCVADRADPGAVVRVHPAIRAWDAGRR